ncbi:MAG: hypothetical protein INH41_11815 [Myxococcaceae bacterium]|nr:hypothetical protein [Myxococcaceae bacterium]
MYERRLRAGGEPPTWCARGSRGGAIFGLSAALLQQVTLQKGRVQQSNFHDDPLLRFDAVPRLEAHVPAGDGPPSGNREPGVPVLAPAVANAVFAMTKPRSRTLPLPQKAKAPARGAGAPP